MNWFRSAFVLTTLTSIAIACTYRSSTRDNDQERIGETRSALTWNDYAASLNPVSWYKFDETSGTTVNDNGYGNHYGLRYQGNSDGVPEMGNPSAVVGGASSYHFGTASRQNAPLNPFGSYTGPYVQIKDYGHRHYDHSLSKGDDDFTGRTVSLQSSWGQPRSAFSGESWSWGSVSNVYSVNAGVASILEAASGTWGQIFPSDARLDTDAQVDVQWGSLTSPSSPGNFYPAFIALRFQDANNFYAARLVEAPGGAMSLQIVKKIAGGTTVLATYSLASGYDHVTYWKFRFQLQTEKSTSIVRMRAKAWLAGTDEPLDWTQANYDLYPEAGTPLAAGKTAIISSNSSSSNHSLVSFKNFWHQSVGFTVSVWIRPTTDEFTQNPSTLLCGAGNGGAGVLENFGHFVSKQENGDQLEWLLRHYPYTAYDVCSNGVNNRRSALTAYGFELDGGPSGKGAGDRFDPTIQDAGFPVLPEAGIANGQWHHVVGMYDSGDQYDRQAGVNICFDGTCWPKKYTDGGVGVGANYADPAYLVNPRAGTAQMRIGAAHNVAAWSQYQGDIDELMIFDYLLTSSEVGALWAYKN